MIKLDENLLIELGLGGLPKPEKTAFLKHMYETLEMRVGTRLAERMSDQQMVEFEQFIKSNDEQGAFRWLETNFPNYKEVVAEEFEKLKNEIRPLVPQIVSASQAQAAQAQTQSHMQPQQPPLPTSGQPAPAPAMSSVSDAPFGATPNSLASQPSAGAAGDQAPYQAFGAPTPQQHMQSQPFQVAPTPQSAPQGFGPAQAPPFSSPQPSHVAGGSGIPSGPQPSFGQHVPADPTPISQPVSPQPSYTQSSDHSSSFGQPFQSSPGGTGQPSQPAGANPYGPPPSFGQPSHPQQPSAFGSPAQPNQFGSGQDPSSFGPPQPPATPPPAPGQ